MILKIEIQELFRDWEETELYLKHSVNVERIFRKTMAKIGKKSGRSSLKKLLIAAACMVLLVTMAAAFWRAARYQAADSVTITFETTDGKVMERNVNRNAVITFEPQEPPSKPNMVGFTLSWLPEQAEEAMEGVTLGRRLEQIGAACSLDAELLEEAKTNVQYVIGSIRSGQVFNVDIYPSGEVADKMFISWGDMTLVKEGLFGEMEALWITTTVEELTSHYLLLYHSNYNCVVKIGTSQSEQEDPFQELEKIAKGLTLVDSGVPSVDPDPDRNWIHLGVGLG